MVWLDTSTPVGFVGGDEDRDGWPRVEDFAKTGTLDQGEEGGEVEFAGRGAEPLGDGEVVLRDEDGTGLVGTACELEGAFEDVDDVPKAGVDLGNDIEFWSVADGRCRVC